MPQAGFDLSTTAKRQAQPAEAGTTYLANSKEPKMTNELNFETDIQLSFFGKIAALFTHDLRNSLAIIGESAGLLEDLVGLSERGLPLDPEKLRRHLSRIKTHIRDADAKITHFNRFAHSTDEREAAVDLGKLVSLFIDLTGRFFLNRNLTVTAAETQPTVTATVNPFDLLLVLWTMLHELTAIPAPMASLELSALIHVSRPAIRIGIGFPETVTGIPEGICRSHSLQSQLKNLSAHLIVNNSLGNLIICLEETK
jgi:hypothetical protein